MISLQAAEHSSGSAVAEACFDVGSEAALISRILDVAEFIGYQEDGQGGRFQLWNLTKSIGGYPKGSTLSRATLETLLGKKSYGKVSAPEQKPEDFAAVESPKKHLP